MSSHSSGEDRDPLVTPRPSPFLRAVTCTVSDTRTASDDSSGQRLQSLLSAAAVEIVRHVVVRDEPADIQREVRSALTDRMDLVVLSGGTGIASRDRTVEAVTPLFDKVLDGFGEAFRRLSWDAIGPRAILSNAVAGVSQRTLIFALPGSPKAVELAVTELILPVLRHAQDLLQGRTSHAPSLQPGPAGRR